MQKYTLLDSGNLQKLEQVGEYRMIRPALNAFWRPELPAGEWARADAVLVRDSSGSGRWDFKRKLPESWLIEWGGFTLKVKPTAFGHLGFFAEQFRNWDYFRSAPALGEGRNGLNLFGYSGIGSMAMAKSGARVCHLDASRGMNEWGQENLEFNFDQRPPIRWIADDVGKFVARELRRGNRYNLIALDPPTFGRGSKGELWKIEEDLRGLLCNCFELREKGRLFTLVLSSHSPGFSPLVFERLLNDVCGRGGEFDAFEMSVPESTGRQLPSGVCAIYTVK